MGIVVIIFALLFVAIVIFVIFLDRLTFYMGAIFSSQWTVYRRIKDVIEACLHEFFVTLFCVYGYGDAYRVVFDLLRSVITLVRNDVVQLRSEDKENMQQVYAPVTPLVVHVHVARHH